MPDAPDILPEPVRRVADAVRLDRVMARLDALAQIGGTPDGGVDRPAFSDAEREATALFAGWCATLGLTVAYDDFGSLFASSDGNAADGATHAAGSHLDSVPNGGRYDGALGCVAALEAVEAMRDAGFAPRQPCEIVVWRAEEPYRFAQGRVGSLIYAGSLAVKDLVPRDPAFEVRQYLAAEAREARPRRAAGRGFASLLELHIEQGRRLEVGGGQIGVVTAVSSTRRLCLTFTGVADHSGATPMELRHDALLAAAEVALATERVAQVEPLAESVATAVAISARPGVMNVVPGSAELLLDIRSTDPDAIARMATKISGVAQDATEGRGVAVGVETLSRGEPVRFAPAVVAEIEAAARALGYTAERMASGAGHDTQSVAHLTRAGMLFVPSRDGISHNPAEYTAPEEIERGVRTLAAVWTRRLA